VLLHDGTPQSRVAEALRGRFVVMTGGSSGIGRALAAQLAAMGARVRVGSRRPPAGGLEHRALELASQASIAEFAGELRREGRPIDMLILSAGVHVPWKRLSTPDGQELHWQVNFLANVLLAQELLELCLRSALKRVVYVASEAHRLAGFPAARLLGFWYRYAKSKQAAVSYFLRLAEQHPELNVRVVSPGYVETAIHRHKGWTAARLERAWSRARSPEEAAREILACYRSGAPKNVYWDRGVPRRPSRLCTAPQRVDAVCERAALALGSRLRGRPPQRITNYAGTFSAVGPAVERPADVAALAALVRRAAERGQNVRIVGRRHSYNDGFYSRTCMISLERLSGVTAFDPERGTITCRAGTPIGTVCEYLDARGFALRYSGNFGEQTLAGALATGTHGYGRDGGLMSELVRGMSVLLSNGRLLRACEERDLAALRLNLGALGAVVDVTLAVERSGPCRYEAACMPRGEFRDRLDELARANEYLRFVPHPFDERAVFYVTINRVPGAASDSGEYINGPCPRTAWLLVPWLRMPAVREWLGRAFGLGRRGYALRVPFSSLLFIRSGVVQRHAGLARIGQLALERHRWLNMELSVPRDRYAEFDRIFAAEAPRLSRFSHGQPYYTCRVVGAARGVLLAPSHGRDAVFCDVHADPALPWAREFLRRLEAVAIRELEARPHWGKAFFAESETLRALYPAENLAAFEAAKRRLDPAGIFSNDYTRRALGL
jgi:L-gulonolactone oxidase